MAAAVDHAAHAAPAVSDKSAPIVVDLGKKSRKQIRQARKGAGKLIDEIQEVVEHLQATGGVAAGAQPIMVVVRQKRRRSGLLFPLG